MYIYVVAIVLLVANQAYAGCPNDWKRFGDSCYFLNMDNHDWMDADYTCKEVSGAAHLVEINSQEELQFLIDHQGNNLEGYFIGAIDSDSEGNWVWYNSGDPVTFQNWADGEPSNSGGIEHCSEMMGNGKWNDVWCGEFQRSICEISYDEYDD